MDDLAKRIEAEKTRELVGFVAEGKCASIARAVVAGGNARAILRDHDECAVLGVETGSTLLHVAVRGGFVSASKLLISQGADPSIADDVSCSRRSAPMLLPGPHFQGQPPSHREYVYPSRPGSSLGALIFAGALCHHDCSQAGMLPIHHAAAADAFKVVEAMLDAATAVESARVSAAARLVASTAAARACSISRALVTR